MEYRTFEAILAKLHDVEPDDMGAFRARIRVLRSMGIPPIPKVGKGSRQEFNDDDLTEMHLALTMSVFGWAPSKVAYVMQSVRTLPSWHWRNKDEESWLIVTVMANAGKLSAAGPSMVARVGIISSAADLIVELRPMKYGAASWNAVLSLQQIARDLAKVTASTRD